MLFILFMLNHYKLAWISTLFWFQWRSGVKNCCILGVLTSDADSTAPRRLLKSAGKILRFFGFVSFLVDVEDLNVWVFFQTRRWNWTSPQEWIKYLSVCLSIHLSSIHPSASFKFLRQSLLTEINLKIWQKVEKSKDNSVLNVFLCFQSN